MNASPNIETVTTPALLIDGPVLSDNIAADGDARRCRRR